MPVNNIKSTSFVMKTKLFSLAMMYCLLVHVLIAVMLFTLIYYFIKMQNFEYSKIIPVIFFLNCFVMAINFVYITWKLPKLMKSWRKVELQVFDGKIDRKVERNSLRILTVFMVVAFVEHFLSKVEDYEQATFCFHFHQTRFEAFARSIIPKFFVVWPYSDFLGLYVIVTCFSSTVVWNFCDVFLITIFYLIFTKLKKFNLNIDAMKLSYGDEKFWSHARRNYTALHEQIRATNGVISFLLMVSMLNDFYFVCNQALGAFR